MSQKALSKYQKMVFQHCKPVNLKWIEEALDILHYIPETHVKTHDKTLFKKRQRMRAIPKLEQVILEALKCNSCSISYLERVLGIKLRTVQKYTRILCKLRWLVFGRWYPFYDLNPFLELIIYIYPKKTRKVVSKFVSLQIDLLNLFALPLQYALDDEVSNVEIRWSQHEPTFGKTYFPKGIHLPVRRLYPYWNGILQLKIEADKKTHYVVLPYNIHWTGRNCHITLPIPFKFYGIESAAYSKSETKIHFDNSIKVAIPSGSASYTTRSLLHKYGMKHWSDSVTRFMIKHWKNEYAECFNFKTHEQVLRDRLINKNIPIKQMADRDLIIKQFLCH